MTAIWRTEPPMKVSDARLTPALTSEECSGCGNETANVRIANNRLTG
jgi:hypothetical protein